MRDPLTEPTAKTKVNQVPLTPEAAAFYRRLAQKRRQIETLLDKNDVRGAERAAEEALRMTGGRTDLVAHDLAPVYLRAGKYEKAASLFGFRASPGNLNLDAAIAFVMTGRLEEARRSYREAHLLAYHPEFEPYLPGSSNARAVEATVFLGRGLVDYDHRKNASALWALEHAVGLIPRNPLALCYYGLALARQGREREARRYFEAAARLDNGTIGRRARAALSGQGRPQKR